MANPTPTQIEQLQSEWTGRFVRIRDVRPELKRFVGRIGRVITVNFNGKAIVDFADGAWYDVSASEEFLQPVSTEEAKGKYDASMNSAQPVPARQS